ncbi:MAG TPA: hypothetical protein VMW28_02940 [Pelolinea sp.]|nr:hypothetical protein [Pelolinea sp.]
MARYKKAVEWIANNDEPTIIDCEKIQDFITTQLVADIFHKEPNKVAVDILTHRAANKEDK